MMDGMLGGLVLKDLDALFEGDDVQTCLASLLDLEAAVSITTDGLLHSSTNAVSNFELPCASYNDLGGWTQDSQTAVTGQSKDYASVFNGSDDDGTSGERHVRSVTRGEEGIAQTTAAIEEKARTIAEHGAQRENRIIGQKHPHGLPIARVKRLMKEHSCHSCNPVAVNLPDLVARSVELFVLDVCAQGAVAALQRGRNVVQVRDLKTVLDTAPHYSFLQDVYDECVKH
jgi:histone H3/H4